MALTNTVSFRPWKEGQQMAKIALDGSLDTATAPQLEKELVPILAGPTQIIVFDLAKLNFLSSGGVRVILGARNEAQLRDNLGAVGWSLSPEQIAKLDKASEVMPSYPYYPYRTQEGFARINPPPV